MLDAETASARTMPGRLRALLGAHEGLRGVNLLSPGFPVASGKQAAALAG